MTLHLLPIGNRLLLLLATVWTLATHHSTARLTESQSQHLKVLPVIPPPPTLAPIPLPPPTHPTIMAHRGCCAYGYGGHAPENTLLAFEYAYSVGARMFETDLRFTLDSQIVMMHDETLDRTTNCSGPVSNWTMADIQNDCEAYSWLDPKFGEEEVEKVRVPSLQDVLDFMAETGMSCVLDLKEWNLTGQVMRLAEVTEGLDTIQLFPAINWANDTADVVANMKRSTIVYNPSKMPPPNFTDPNAINATTYFGDLREQGVDAFYPWWTIDSPSIWEIAEATRRVAMPLWGWTLDTPMQWIGAAMAGIQVFCTNDPEGAATVYRTRNICLENKCLTNSSVIVGDVAEIG